MEIILHTGGTIGSKQPITEHSLLLRPGAPCSWQYLDHYGWTITKQSSGATV